MCTDDGDYGGLLNSCNANGNITAVDCDDSAYVCVYE